jgi:hypothetical protein
LRTQLTFVIGCEENLGGIAVQLANPACRLLTLVAAVGIGKTVPAFEAAVQQLEAFCDGVYFVSVLGIQLNRTESADRTCHQVQGCEA